MFKSITLLPLLLLSLESIAASVVSISKITDLYTYGTYDNNNTSYLNQIIVKVQTPAAGCEAGFFISSDDNTGNPTMVSFLLSAFHAGSDVKFSGLDNDTWHGSTGKYCRVIYLGLVK